MRRNRFRYTEYKFGASSNVVTFVLVHILLGPIRLVNEVSQKLLFVGYEKLGNVFRSSVVVNVLLIVWAFVWPKLTGSGAKPFILIEVLLATTVVLVILYLAARDVSVFGFDILEYVEEEDDDLFDFDSEVIATFANVKAAEVEFRESIFMFIDDPQELEASGVRAEVYQASEEVRMVEALKSASGKEESTEIVIPDLFSGPPLGTKLSDNFGVLRDKLADQIDKRGASDVDVLAFEL